jgi:hypothetical protein
MQGGARASKACAARTARNTEEVVMSFPARKIEMEHKMNTRTALDEKVDPIQSDVADLKPM